MNCIFCDKLVVENSIEHIIPESLGNKHYILQIGSICRVCNNLFSKFEAKALSIGILAMSRPIAGYATKKGRPAKGQSHGIRFEGNGSYIGNRVTVFGLTEDNVKQVNPDGSILVDIQDFDKNEVSVSKLILKIGIESLYQSQRKLYSKFNFEELKSYLINSSNIDWPFVTTTLRPPDFKTIPRFKNKVDLKKIKCEILYKHEGNETLLLNFRYQFLSYLINLSTRNLNWVEPYQMQDKLLAIQLQKKKSPKT